MFRGPVGADGFRTLILITGCAFLGVMGMGHQKGGSFSVFVAFCFSRF